MHNPKLTTNLPPVIPRPLPPLFPAIHIYWQLLSSTDSHHSILGLVHRKTPLVDGGAALSWHSHSQQLVPQNVIRSTSCNLNLCSAQKSDRSRWCARRGARWWPEAISTDENATTHTKRIQHIWRVENAENGFPNAPLRWRAPPMITRLSTQMCDKYKWFEVLRWTTHKNVMQCVTQRMHTRTKYRTVLEGISLGFWVEGERHSF